MKNPVGLYIHIPFCHAKCGYCDFATFTGQETSIDHYLTSLEQELKSTLGKIKDPVTPVTLFIGGGTPTVLSPKQIHALFSRLRRHLNLDALVEATVEANPESASQEKLEAFAAEGINRVSFGLQTTDDTLLKELDRLHTADEFKNAYARARKIGIKNMNADLIYGLPGQTLEQWKKSVTDVLALAPEHVSAYALKIEEGTKFFAQKESLDGDLQADMYLFASETLKDSGYTHYEISNFSKPGYESKHNLRYWENEPVLGLGVSAASYYNGHRWSNTRSLVDYLKTRAPQVEETVLHEDARQKESVMLKLRLSTGVPEGEIQQLGSPLFKNFLSHKLAFVEKGMYCLTPKGWLVSNQLFEQLI